jgi:ABC-2 type transport system permease protein
MASANVPLQAAAGRGWLVGFGNMVDKEYGSWWRTRRGLLHVFLWLLVINGFLFLVGVDEHGGNPYRALNELIQIFFQVGGLFATIGIIVSTQSSVLGERQLGTAEWVLSKPVTREAFLLSKLLVNGVTFIGLAVVIPTVAFFLQTLLHTYLQPSPGPFMLGLALHVEQLVFYLALTLALGAVLSSRGAVSGVAIGLLFAGLILPNFFPSLMTWTPFALPAAGYMVATGRPLSDGAWVPILVTVLWTLLFVLVALWRFDREEL